MMYPMAEIEWGDDRVGTGGQILVDAEGVSIGTNCHGCFTLEPLNDRAEILKLYHALGDYLIATAPENDH